jgi:hypothetical protein
VVKVINFENINNLQRSLPIATPPNNCFQAGYITHPAIMAFRASYNWLKMAWADYPVLVVSSVTGALGKWLVK